MDSRASSCRIMERKKRMMNGSVAEMLLLFVVECASWL